MTSATTATMLGKPVGRVGLGLMMLTLTPTPPSDEEAFAAIKAGIDNGCNVLNSAVFYGTPISGPRANLDLLNRFFEKYPEYADKTIVAVKGGMNLATLSPTGDLETLRAEATDAQAHLGPRKKIDLYIPARIPEDVTLEQLMENLKTLKFEGLFSAVGLSEVTAATMRKAHAIIPLSGLELEVSLFNMEKDIKEAVATATQLGIPIMAYSPMGRGMLGGQLKSPDEIDDSDPRKRFPMFSPENFPKNLELVKAVEALAKNKGCTPGQISLAYILQLSPMIIPIPGSSKPSRVIENAQSVNVKLEKSDLAEIEKILSSFSRAGDRYPAHFQTHLMR